MRRFALTLMVGLALAGVSGCTAASAPTAPSRSAPAAPERHTVAHVRELERGTRQSPIAIFSRTAHATHGHSIVLDYGKSSERVANRGHTIEVDYDPGSTITFDGRPYVFKQFHFHTPSEHHVDGERFPMEMHMVHSCPFDPQRYLVIAVLFRSGPERDPFLDEFMEAIPRDQGSETRTSAQVDIRDVFGPRDHYFVYDGSLTTPPFTEHVQWLVLTRPRRAAQAQIDAFHTLEGDNARFVQPAAARSIDYQ
jgi:carbonic anhydrase